MFVLDPRESLGFHCNLTLKAFLRAVEIELRDTGVSQAQYVALAQLIASGPLSQSKLVDRLTISRATGVRLVDRMERDGWVVRRRDPNDDRIKLVVPTERAVETWGRISSAGRKVVDLAYQGISPEEVETAKQILQRMRDNLQE